jgi:hypothetical protein
MEPFESVQIGALVTVVVLAGATYYLVRLRSRQIADLSHSVRQLLMAEIVRACEPCERALSGLPEGAPVRTLPEGFEGAVPIILQPGFGPLRYLSDEEQEIQKEFNDRLQELLHRASHFPGVDLRPDLEGVLGIGERLLERLQEAERHQGPGHAPPVQP